jgi:hypothetical protein
MRDRDMRMLEERYESLFSGKIEEDEDTSLGSDKKDDDDKDSDDKDSDSDDSDSDDSDSDDSDSDDSDSDSDDSDSDSDDSDSDSDDSDSDDSDSDDSDSDDDSDDSDGFKSKEGGDSGIQSKVKQLQKQYNDLLVDAFEKYAAECIETALDGVESSFGENITDILDQALAELKTKILGDLGVEDSGCCGGMDADMGGEMGGMEMEIGGEPEVEFGSAVGGIPTMTKIGDGEDSGDSDDSEDEEEEEPFKKESRKVTLGKKKIVTESALAAKFYGFV